MKKNFQEQFDNLRQIIKMNVETLQNLLNQSEQLSKIILTLKSDETQEANRAIAEQLETLKEQISKSISELTRQTESLFKSYEMLIDEVFGKK
jgi:methyl-accepting chemotaxis protein